MSITDRLNCMAVAALIDPLICDPSGVSLTNTGVFAVVKPSLPPGEVAVNEARYAAYLTELNREGA